jgi:ribosomal-protein-alanine N-acetyltransferase
MRGKERLSLENKSVLYFQAMTEEDGYEICGWRYPAPYDSYRWPSWESMVNQGCEFGDEHIRNSQYRAVRNGQEQLVGYVQFFAMDRTMRIGMGLKPDCCDQGWGPILTKLAVKEAGHRQPDAEIDLEVEQWNKRAIRAYEKAGFVVTDEYERYTTHGTVIVFCMVWHNK